MDETALAIARMREEAKADKPARSGRPASGTSKPQLAHAGSGSSRRLSDAAAPSVTTKRQKSG